MSYDQGLPPDLPSAAFAFAREELGPASVQLLASAPVQRVVAARLATGVVLEDAVLGALHGYVARSRAIANEFMGYFLYDLMDMGKISMASSSRLRRFLDTGDLVLSVFGDVWGDISSLQFEGRAQFKTLFARRMRWKAADRARRLTAGHRREDRRVSDRLDVMDLPAHDPSSGPLPRTIQQEEKERLILILLRLNDRDRQILTLHLKGAPLESIAETLELSYEAARRALSRAVDQARSLAEASARRRGTVENTRVS